MPTHRLRPIDNLTTEWAALCRQPESRRALDRLADAEPLVAELDCVDLGDLVAALRSDNGILDRTHAAAVVRAMLRSEHAHPLVGRALLQAVLPGLLGVARRLSWGRGGDWEDGGAFFADLVATTWEVLTGWSGSDRPYAVLDVLSAVRCRVRRQIMARRIARTKVVGGWELDPGDGPDPAGRDPGPTAIDRLAALIDDLDGRGLESADAAVLYGHRVLGLSLTDLARLSDQPRRQLDARYQRAASTLSAALSV
jgi:hypothetical protein